MQGYVEFTVIRQWHDEERRWIEYIALPVGSFLVKYTRTYNEPRQYKTLIKPENGEEFYCCETYGEVLSLIKKASSRGTVENVYEEKQRQKEKEELEAKKKAEEYENGCRCLDEDWCGVSLFCGHTIDWGKNPNCKDFDNGNCLYLKMKEERDNSNDNGGNSKDKAANSKDSGTFQNGNNHSFNPRARTGRDATLCQP